MKVRLEITGLETHGDSVTVIAQGSLKREAEWRPMHRWQFTVPAYVGNRYRLGQIIRASVA